MPSYETQLYSLPSTHQNSRLYSLKKEMTYVHPVLSTEGRLGHLTAEQTEMLQQFWIRLYHIFDPFDQTVPSYFNGQARDKEGATPKAG